jgi:hypothetical protein
MSERDEELERGVALAKSALAAPVAVRARVRAKLAEAALAASAGATGATSAAPLANGSRLAGLARRPSHAVGWAVAWVGLGLCAGYWLGFHRVGASLVEPVPSAAPSDRGVAFAAAGAPGSAPSASKTLVGAAETPGAGAAASALGGERAREGRGRSSAARRAELATSERAGDVSSSEPAASSFAAEVALLERAERAIRAGEGALALAFLAELDQKFPTSTLREERAAARVLAGCEQARSNGAAARTAARAAAEQFLARGSALYADRVRQLCELGSSNARPSIEDPREPGH